MHNDIVALDLEVYPNYTLFAFKHKASGKVATVELIGEESCLTSKQRQSLVSLMSKRTTFGFNSRNFDMTLILYALTGKTAFEIFELADAMIRKNLQGWMVMRDHGLRVPEAFDHFDVQEPAPGVRVSLKLYGARMGTRWLRDLPIEPGTILTEEQMGQIKTYCINDLDQTIELLDTITGEMDLRVEMSAKYCQDLMSKSDAQIAEAVVKSEIQKIVKNKRFVKPKLPADYEFSCQIPDFVKFKRKDLNDLVKNIRAHHFTLSAAGKPELPDFIKKSKIKLGHSTYKLGLGGIHSTEKSQTIIPEPNQILKDKDVTSYYPFIILNNKWFPRHIGAAFLKVYRDIVETRLHAKSTGDDVVAGSLKIVINGLFGKFGSKWSAFYSPDLLISVTLTGQLCLLMLIEAVEDLGIPVVSANTDGFVSLIDEDKLEEYERVCDEWQYTTNFNLEATDYSALYSRDINNYVAVYKHKDFAKGKGVFSDFGLQKNPAGRICYDAAIALLKDQTPIKKTIFECKDITQFVFCRTVNGGAVFRDEYLGKVVRWVYSTEGDQISYKKNGNKVPKSDNGLPVMTIDDTLPPSLDYRRYVSETMSVLEDVGLFKI